MGLVPSPGERRRRSGSGRKHFLDCAPWLFRPMIGPRPVPQTLARTVRGMMTIGKALRILAEMENPRPSKMPRREYEIWLNTLSDSKFRYLVTAQVSCVDGRVDDCGSQWLKFPNTI